MIHMRPKNNHKNSDIMENLNPLHKAFTETYLPLLPNTHFRPPNYGTVQNSKEFAYARQWFGTTVDSPFGS